MAVAAVWDTELAWVADPDSGAAVVLAHRHPQVPNLGDITAVDWADVPAVDLVAAGFPCQDLSYAGQGEGIREGNRSGLWHTIAHALGVLRPRLVVLENVAAIVVRRPGLDVVLADLARLGFAAVWTCVRASDAGAPHVRNRWFLLAHAEGARLQGPRLGGRATGGGGAAADADRLGVQRDRSAGQLSQRHAPRPGGSVAHAEGVGEREPADETVAVAGGGQARPEPCSRGVQSAADSQSERHGDAGQEGFGRLPAAAVASAAAPAADTEGDGRDEGRPESARLVGGSDAAALGGCAPVAHADRERLARRAERDRPSIDGQTDHEQQRLDADRCDVDWGRYRPAVQRWEGIIGQSAPTPRLPTGRDGADQLNPVFVEWMQGLPAGHVTAVPSLTRNQQLKLLGNGVVPQQGADALRLLLSALGEVTA